MKNLETPALRLAAPAALAIAALVLVELAVPASIKPWIIGAQGCLAAVLLGCLALRARRPGHRLALLLATLFAVAVPLDVLYLRTLPDAAIPLAGVGLLFGCLLGLLVTGVLMAP